MQEKLLGEIELLKASLKKINHLSSLLSWARALSFLCAIGAIIFSFKSENHLWFALPTVLLVGFYVAVLQHRKAEREKLLVQTYIDLKDEEIERLKLSLRKFDNGERFIIDNHPYHIDLDVFGNHSLFQLLDRCEIEDSKKMLANWLSQPANDKEITERQSAIKELNEDLPWIAKFRATVRIAINQKKEKDPTINASEILAWINQSIQSLGIRTIKSIAFLLILVVVISGYLIIIHDFVYQIIYPIIFVNSILLFWGVKRLQKLISGIDKAYYIADAYASALELVEKKKFASPRLVELQNRLKKSDQSATQSIRRLSKIIHRIAGRANMLYAILDLPLLLDVFLLIDIYKWKKENRDNISDWLTTINEIECLLSIATFSYYNPDYSWPTISNGAAIFETKELGHPLISNKDKIRNDYVIANAGSLDIITGSNMSGKSTFQRTVGVSMIMAQAGFPVDALELKMNTTHVFTSMRTKDNLEEHTSSFYAELKRIKQLLEVVETNDSTFYILDEILKGTNSQDRHLGSIALAEKLTTKNAFGLISTHDLDLGNLADQHPRVRNFSFNSTLDGDKIIFDYKLTSGICQSFNASQLMKNMGIVG